jgi:signal transduction histidine kinase
VLSLKLALQELGPGHEEVRDLLSEALDHAERANSDLRALARGIMPAVLTGGGIRAGIDELASHSPLPVTTNVSVERLPAAVEATAYFVVSEALTNAVKHSHAAGIWVNADVAGDVLRLEVRDDGDGGAQSGMGTGLTGMRDRVEALAGTLELDSPAGAGTSLSVEIPIDVG